jgi:alkylation response protein AidB-like acyl-CoA dehydrogenase
MMRYLVEATVAYLRERKQFGRALAEFQALQHRAVDMLIETELAEAASLRALLSFESGHRDQELAVAAAKVTASGSARFVGQNTIQLHGGKGMDASTRVTDYFRALTAFELSFGLASQHIARIAALER